MKIKFRAWSSTALIYPGCAIRTNGDLSNKEAVARAIAAKNHLSWCALRRDGRVYVFTVGKPCRGGGITPMGQVYFDIKEDIK